MNILLHNLKKDYFIIRSLCTKSNLIAAFLILIIILIMGIFDMDCPILHASGISCPGCGMTRAYFCLASFDFKGAFWYHPLWWMVPFVPVFWLIHKRGVISRNAYLYFLYIFAASFLFTHLIRLLFFRSDVVQFHPENGAIYHLYQSIFSLFLS